MRKGIVAGFVVAATTAQLAAQQGGAQFTSFQIEATGGWSTTSTDTSPDADLNEFFVLGTYHLKPVMLADHPWNEAAFLEHSTFVQAGLSFAELEVGNFSADGPLFRVGGTYAEKDKPIAAQLNLQFGTLDGDSGTDVDRMSFDGRVGYWLMPNAIVGAELALDDTEIGSSVDVDKMSFGAFGKIVHPLGEGRSVNGEAHLALVSVDDGVSDDTNVEFGVAADYYFTKQYSVGALVNLSFGDVASEEGITLGLRGTAWITPRVSVNAAFSTFMADDDTFGADQDFFTLFVTARF
jgi:hypothetical protein